jgi:hypothetical protein
MIKANELRIGNLIMAISPFRTISGKNEIITVTGLFIRQCEIAGGEITNYDPIALTAEWLEKFGFTIGDHRYVKGEYSLLSAHDGFMFGRINHLPIIKDGLRYVHQLQNIYFAVTGEELTIKEIQPS